MFKLCLFAFTFTVAVVSFANEVHPCKTIEDSCLAAGFKKRHAGGKGFWKDCMKPILDGKSVNGVSVETTTVEACKAKRAKK